MLFMRKCGTRSDDDYWVDFWICIRRMALLVAMLNASYALNLDDGREVLLAFCASDL